MQSVLADMAVSVSELKKNPTAVLNGAHGGPSLSSTTIASWVIWCRPKFTKR